MRASSEEEDIKPTLMKEEERKLYSKHLLALIHFLFPFIFCLAPEGSPTIVEVRPYTTTAVNVTWQVCSEHNFTNSFGFALINLLFTYFVNVCNADVALSV